MKKFVSQSCFLLFLFYQLPSLSGFEIPSEYARLEKKFEGTNGKTIFLIQEAHSNYQVQKNIAELLRYLIQSHGLHLVLVEGGWENVSLSYLRNYGSPEGRLKVAEDYLESGKISGEEYLDITSDLEIQLWGIEGPKLYERNMKAFLAIDSKQAQWLAELSKLKSALDARAEKIFPKPLQEFRKKQEAFEGHKISLLEYLQFLERLTSCQVSFCHSHESGNPKPGFPIKSFGNDNFKGGKNLKNFPNLEKLITLAGEGEFDPAKVEWEKHELIRALSRRMAKPELEELALYENRKTTEEEMAFIQVLLAAYERETTVSGRLKVEHLKRYARALEEGLKIDSKLLFSELHALEDQITELMTQTSDQKQLLAMHKTVASLEKLFKLELGPEDFASLRRDEFLRKDVLQYALTTAPKIDVSLLQRAVTQAQEFYLAAESREKAMIENALRKMEEGKVEKAVLISGGFHTEELSRSFQKRGFTVLILSPRFSISPDSESQQKRYFQILKENWEPPAAGSITNVQFNPIQGEIKNAAR